MKERRRSIIIRWKVTGGRGRGERGGAYLWKLAFCTSYRRGSAGWRHCNLATAVLKLFAWSLIRCWWCSLSTLCWKWFWLLKITFKCCRPLDAENTRKQTETLKYLEQNHKTSKTIWQMKQWLDPSMLRIPESKQKLWSIPNKTMRLLKRIWQMKQWPSNLKYHSQAEIIQQQNHKLKLTPFL